MTNVQKRIRVTTPEVEQAARDLRHRLTPAEAKLWQALRNRQLGGLRWRSQHPLGRFIVDFCCPACRLIIEVDGEIHHQKQDYDDARTKHLQQYCYTVIRFSNQEIETNFEGVLATIYRQASTP